MEKQHERFAKQNGKTRKIRASSRHTGISAAKMEALTGTILGFHSETIVVFSFFRQWAICDKL
jgi:hypothetical protein